MGKFIPLELPPGVFANGTNQQAAHRWRDSSLVRWSNGALGPVGGWQTWTQLTNKTTGVPRSALAWTDNSGNRWMAAGTASKLHVYNDAGEIYDITPTGFTAGREDASSETGYGKWLFGKSTYGNERPDTGQREPATMFKLSTWGEDLIAGTQFDGGDGKLYYWDSSVGTGTKAALISNAPTKNLSHIVTGERFLVAIGADEDRTKVQWSDQENHNSWTPASTNQAGSLSLGTNGELITAVTVRGQTLILGTNDVFTMNYIGPPFIFGFEKVGTDCGVVSQQACAVVDGVAYWMGERGFFTFDGYVRSLLPCDVLEFVQDNISEVQVSKTIAWANSEFAEVWFIFPDDTTNECSKAVSYNYREKHWATHSFARTAVAGRGSFNHPMLWASNGQPYEHEVGTAYPLIPSGAGTVYAESGPIQLMDGDRMLSCTSLIPDEKTLGSTNVTFYGRMYPTDSDSVLGPYTLEAPTDVRFTQRSVRLRVTGDSATEWRWGIPRLEVSPGGRR